MAQAITQYRVISNAVEIESSVPLVSLFSTFENKIDALLALGWEPWAGLFTHQLAQDEQGRIIVYQILVKRGN